MLKTLEKLLFYFLAFLFLCFVLYDFKKFCEKKSQRFLEQYRKERESLD